MNRLLIVVAVALLLLAGCKTTQPVRPMEEYEERQLERVSIINIPIDIQLDELETSLNRQLSGTLYEDNNLKDDNLRVRAVKQDQLRLGLDGEALTYRVPLDLWVQYDLGISKVEATGQITLDFKTAVELAQDWDILTKTEVTGYDWVQKPRLKLAGINLPVGLIADLVLRNSKSTIAASIDDMVKQQFDLQATVQEAWKQMFEPSLISEEYRTWLVVNPQFIGMSPLEMRNNRIRSTIYVESKPQVKIGEKPQPAFVRSLPPLIIAPVEASDFTLHLNTQISYEEAERLAKVQLVGEQFSYGKRSVTVEDLEFYGQNDQIIVNTKLSGTYNGSIYLSGKPVYNTAKNTIDIKDLEYTLDTKNKLFRSAGWLFKSAIKNKIEENFDFLLDYNLKDMQQQFQEQLQSYEVAQGITLSGDLREINIEDAFLTPEGMVVDLALGGRLNVEVKGLY